MADTRRRPPPTRATSRATADPIWPADTGGVFAVGTAGDDDPPTQTDGRRLRRALNREAVVDALLDLYAEGNLRPSTDEIAERAKISPRSLFRYFEDADDLAGEAVARQLARVLPVLPIDAVSDDPFAERVRALVDQRLRLFTTMGQAAHVSRLRAPFQPRLAESLVQGRRFLRGQVRTLFTTELTPLADDRRAAALASVDILTGYETFQLLTGDRGLSADEVRSVLTLSLTALLHPGERAR
jgi:TetR/AcrR family transcriptional regulator, regulator of autoinduction and epiphytic fitness